MTYLYEILVPTIYGDTLKPIRTRHHKVWDTKVQKISGGLTIMSPAKGKWVYKGEEYPEDVIPVRIKCTDMEMYNIGKMTMEHYRQKAVMYYRLSDDVHILYNHDLIKKLKENE